MNIIDRNYLINQLNDGRIIDCLFMIHNAYHSQFLILNRIYENAKFECIGGSTSYLRMRCKRGYIIQNHDFIILYGLGEYRNYEFDEMKNIAKKISNENNKRVSIGYSYFIPLEKRINGLSEEVKFASYKDNDEYEEILLPSELNANDLASLIIQNHDLLENQKVKKIK